MEDPKSEIQMNEPKNRKTEKPKKSFFRFLVFTFFSFLVFGFWSFDAAWGASIIKDSSAEFAASGAVFTNTKVSGETVALKVSGGTLWTENGVPVVAASGDQDQVDIASDGSGGVFVVWRDNRSNPFGDIYISKVTSVGAVASGWPQKVVASSVTAEAPHVVKSVNSGGIDGVIVVWKGYIGDIGGSVALNKNIYAKKFDLNGTVVWTAEVCTANGDQSDPRLISDNAGGAVFVWKDAREGGNSLAIYAQRLDSTGNIPAGTSWITNGVTVCAAYESGKSTFASEPEITYASLGADEYMIAWYDKRDNYPNSIVYVNSINNKGILRDDFGANGKAIVNPSPSLNQNNFSFSNAVSGVVFAWQEGSTGNRDIYAQWIWPDGTRAWGDSGIIVCDASGDQWQAFIASIPTGEAICSWLDQRSFNYETYVQRLNISGEAQWGTNGKSLGATPLILGVVHDGFGGIYGMAMSATRESQYCPYARRIDGSGNEVWGDGGVQVSLYAGSSGELNIVASETEGPIVAWVDNRNGNKDVFVQKITDLYYSSGTYTTEKIENTDYRFVSWGSVSWEAAGSLTAEVRTAATSSALDSASWTTASNGESIPSNGKWIQARIYFISESDRRSTPSLRSLSFNYSTDTSYPSIESVRIGSETLIPGGSYWVSSAPTIDAVLTDDYRISSADIKIDDVSVGCTTISSTETRWEIRGQPSTPLTVGNHTLKIEVADDAGNITTGTYTIAVEPTPRVEGTITFSASSVPGEIIINYTLTAGATTTIEIRNLVTGELVRRFSQPSSAGTNSVPIDVSGLSRGPYGIVITPSGGTPVTGRFMVP